MPIDINLFRTNPELVRKSQKQRFKPVELVDKVVELDNQIRKGNAICVAYYF